jgi:alpha-beta hydrolase superfamily lysophospholipase
VVLFWIGILLLISVPLTLFLALVALYWYLVFFYLHNLGRIFLERPIFNIPRGEPIPGVEEVRFPTTDGLSLHGRYLKTVQPRRGVILFGVEYGADCWSCSPYVESLLAAGFDVFVFEPRNQGTSDAMPEYEPLQWLTDFEVADTRAALQYLRSRPDADPRGVGFFGISKGGNAGLYVASEDPYIRCCLTDGAFATHLVVLAYFRQWFTIYIRNAYIQGLLPMWFYAKLIRRALKEVEAERRCHYPVLEESLPRLAPRPLLMIHGQCDTYIRPDMARALFERAGKPREFWVVPGARHNQAVQLAGDEYRARVLAFFEMHLAADRPGAAA